MHCHPTAEETGDPVIRVRFLLPKGVTPAVAPRTVEEEVSPPNTDTPNHNADHSAVAAASNGDPGGTAFRQTPPDMESATRGFTVTGAEAFLEPLARRT